MACPGDPQEHRPKTSLSSMADTRSLLPNKNAASVETPCAFAILNATVKIENR